MLARISALVAIFGLAGVTSAADYCLCRGAVINNDGNGANAFASVTLEDPVTASATVCGLACDARTDFDCNSAQYFPGGRFCNLFNINFLRDGTTSPYASGESLAAGSCASYGIDTSAPGAVCEDFSDTPVLPTQVKRRRQLESERRKRNAYAAGIY